MSAKKTTQKAVRRKLPRAVRERQMLEVAARVFGRRGYRAASMEEIARACGVTKPMLYAYFGSKDGLFLATVDRTGVALVSAVERLLEERDAVKRLHQGVDLVLRFIEQDRHTWAVMYAEGIGEAPVEKRVSSYRERIVQAAAVTLVDAVPGSSLKQAEPYAVGLLGTGEALARWWLDRSSLPFAEVHAIVHVLVEAVLTAFRAGAPPPTPGVTRRELPAEGSVTT